LTVVARRDSDRSVKRPSSWGLGISILAFLAGVAGCSEQTLSPGRADAIATVTDETADFSSLRTFSLPNELSEICLSEELPAGQAGSSMGGAGTTECLEVEHSRDLVILQEIRQQMEDRGYVLAAADSPAPPDVALLVGILAQSYLKQWEQGTRWCDASVWLPGCWETDYEYPHTLSFGTVLVDLAILEESKKPQVRVGWSAILSNLVAGEVPREDAVRKAVEQAFAQSPQLGKGDQR
jgi:hypothetical protein